MKKEGQPPLNTLLGMNSFQISEKELDSVMIEFSYE